MANSWRESGIIATHCKLLVCSKHYVVFFVTCKRRTWQLPDLYTRNFVFCLMTKTSEWMEQEIWSLEVLTAVVMNVAIFWDVAQCSLFVNRRFGGTYHLLLQGWKSAEQETSVQQVSRPKHAGFLLGWFWALRMEVIFFSETLLHIRTTRRYIRDDGNVQDL
jgi:hypothetical protein